MPVGTDLRMVPNVELLRAGTFKASTGEVTFTRDHLLSIVRASHDPDVRRAPIVIGHQGETKFAADGAPTYGYIDNLRVEDDSLIGDMIAVPAELAAETPKGKGLPGRSVEVRWNVETPNGAKHVAVLERLALLGATRPAVEGLRPIEGIYRTAASGSYTDEGTSAFVTITNASAETPPTNPTGGQGMDPAKIRSLLGLPADATDEQVEAAITAKTPPVEGQPPAAEAPPAGAPAGDLVNASGSQGSGATLPATVTVDASQWENVQAGLTRLAALEEKDRVAERDAFLNQAMREGRFAPASLSAYQASFDKAPTETKNLVTSLAAGSVPVTTHAAGYTGEGDTLTEDDAAWAAFAAMPGGFGNFGIESAKGGNA